MNYLNLEIADLNSEKVKGSNPVERGTWLMLQAYCAAQENGGRILGSRHWKCQKWQQLTAVMLKEVKRECDLWEWDGDDLVVWGYPVDQERKVQAKREAGCVGGRSRSQAKVEAARQNGASRTQAEGEAEGEANTQAEPKLEPNVKERKGREGKGSTPKPPEGASVGAEASRHAETRDRCLPEKWRNIPTALRKVTKCLRNTPLMVRVGSWFNRKPETLWTVAEALAIHAINPPEEEVALLESWYLAADVGPRDIRRQDLLTLLNNWPIDRDRAQLWRAENP